MKPIITGSNPQKKQADPIPAPQEKPSLMKLLFSVIKWKVIFISVLFLLAQAGLFLYLWNACFGTLYPMGYFKCLGVLIMARMLVGTITNSK